MDRRERLKAILLALGVSGQSAEARIHEILALFKESADPGRWKPTRGRRYFLILSNGDIKSFPWNNTPFDQEAWDFGNCFRLRREAQQARDTVKELLLYLHSEYGR